MLWIKRVAQAVAEAQARSTAATIAVVDRVGNVLGVVVTSLVLLPWLGLRDGFHFNLALNLIAGSALLLVAGEVAARRRVVVSAVASVIVVFYLLVGTDWSDAVNLARNHLRLRAGPAASLDVGARARHPARRLLPSVP